MAQQTVKERASKTKKKESPPPTEQTEGKETQREHAENVMEITDDFLDEIEGILEENAEAFVSGYIQRGGE